jgi:uncharacterized protein (UPF0333 family)
MNDLDKFKLVFLLYVVILVFTILHLAAEEKTKTIQSDKELKPSQVRVECINNKCDTTWIYQLQED